MPFCFFERTGSDLQQRICESHVEAIEANQPTGVSAAVPPHQYSLVGSAIRYKRLNAIITLYKGPRNKSLARTY